jgi:phosphoribosylanthranilate isomerase
MRTRVKICGITRAEDARMAAELGADAIGLIFYARSSRAVTPEQARGILRGLPPFVSVVGLFVDPGPGQVEEALAAVRLDALQFHGDECPAECGIFGVPYLKAVPMATTTNVAAYAASYPDAAGFVLDSHGGGRTGGTGESFDWDAYPRDLDRPLILAGGLSPENVARAVEQTRPYAVDVSSGVESAPGIKDATRLASFIEEVRRVDCSR